ncbi:MAG: hypothetical protein ACK5NI_01760 [bacterium]|jgi:hypothetical protein
MNMTNFALGPNTTATRFFNPAGNKAGQHYNGSSGSMSPHAQNNMMNDTQSRFMQNI